MGSYLHLVQVEWQPVAWYNSASVKISRSFICCQYWFSWVQVEQLGNNDICCESLPLLLLPPYIATILQPILLWSAPLMHSLVSLSLLLSSHGFSSVGKVWSSVGLISYSCITNWPGWILAYKTCFSYSPLVVGEKRFLSWIWRSALEYPVSATKI